MKKAHLVSPGDLVEAKSSYSLYVSDDRRSERFIMDKNFPVLVVSVREDPAARDVAGNLISVCVLTSSPELPLGWFYTYSSYFEDYFSILAPAP